MEDISEQPYKLASDPYGLVCSCPDCALIYGVKGIEVKNVKCQSCGDHTHQVVLEVRRYEDIFVSPITSKVQALPPQQEKNGGVAPGELPFPSLIHMGGQDYVLQSSLNPPKLCVRADPPNPMDKHLSKKQLLVYNFIKDHPGYPSSVIASNTGYAAHKASCEVHLRTLVKMEVIEARREKGIMGLRYYVKKDVVDKTIELIESTNSG